MTIAPLIRFSCVTKSFDGGTAKAVDNVSLDVAEGEFSGGGRRLGLGQDHADAACEPADHARRGKHHRRRWQHRGRRPIDLRRRIGYVFQSGGLFPHMSIADNIGITPKLLGTPARDIADRVDELLDLVRLDRGSIAIAFPTNCRAASASASALHALSPPDRASC